MKIEYFWSLVATCIVSAGGVGGIITALIKFSSDFITEKVASMYKYKLEKTLENHSLYSGNSLINKLKSSIWRML